MIQGQTIDVTRRQGMFLAAGIGAGIVAALGTVGVQLATGVHIAPLPEIAWSAVLEADDGLAAEAAVAKRFEQLGHAVQFNRGADARSDRAVREHAHNRVQPLRR